MFLFFQQFETQNVLILFLTALTNLRRFGQNNCTIRFLKGFVFNSNQKNISMHTFFL